MYKNFNELYPNSLELKRSDKCAIIINRDNTQISYNELIDRAEAFAKKLTAAGITKKNRILLNNVSLTNFVPELIGMLNVCSVCILDSNIRSAELDHLISLGNFSGILDGSMSCDNFDLSKEGCDEKEGMCVISSGTSGKDANLVSVPRTRFHYWAFNSMRMFGENTRSLVVVSLTFSAGSSHLISTLLNGGTAILATETIHGDAGQIFLKKALKHKPNHIHGAPETYKILTNMNVDSTSLKHCRITGSKSNTVLLNKIFDTINPDLINSVYGTNENGPAFVNIMKSKNEINESIGIPDEGYEYKIDNSGQMWIRGGSGNSQFQNTEDLAEEKEGKIYLTGRSGDVIINNSYCVVPSEVEDILEKCDNVDQVVVFGKQIESTSSKVCCIYTVNDSYIDGNIEEYAKSSLSSYKIPVEWTKVKEVPMTENAKISRAKLQKIF